MTDGTPKAHTVLLCCRKDFPQRDISDSSCRIIDYPSESLLIIRIHHEPEICDNILNLLALIETQSSIDAVGNAFLAQLLFKDATLRIGTVEDGEVAIAGIFLFLDFSNSLAHHHGFLTVAIQGDITQSLAHIVSAEYIFPYLPLIVRDKTVCRLHDDLSGPIVLFEFEKPGAFV